MKDKGIPNGSVITFDASSRAQVGYKDAIFGFRKMFWTYLNKVNVPFFDPCCPSASEGETEFDSPYANLPVRFNDETDILEYFNGTSWGAAPLGVLTTDSITLDDGTVGALALRLGADTNNGLYGVSDTQLGFAVEGVLVGGANTTGLFTDNIAEQTAAAGVTIDSVKLKDGGVSNTAGTQFAGFFPTTAAQAITGAGAVNVTSFLTKFTSSGVAQALTLASGTQIGQRKKISHVVDGGSGVLTGTFVGGTNITFTTVGEFADLIWDGASWAVLELGNSATPAVVPVLA